MIFTTSTRTQFISKEQVWLAWQKVRQGGTSMGVDQVSIAMIDRNPGKYLYPLWNRLASGSYFPAAVKEEVIPKGNGQSRYLGIPTFCDRVAQEVIRAELEAILEPQFLPDSFGYRPGRGAHDALLQCSRHCWERWYVVDVDIRGFFDNLDHQHLMQMLGKHTDCSHILLYCERWLGAPILRLDGRLDTNRVKGTPQGGVISPLLANLYLHECFDLWMEQNHGIMVYERYCDDIVIHTRSLEQSSFIYERLRNRLSSYGLELNSDKTKTVYCYRTARFHKETKAVPVSFDFLGFTFKPHLCERDDGQKFWGFGYGISNASVRHIMSSVKGLLCHGYSYSLTKLAEKLNPLIQGWVYYYGHPDLKRLYNLFNKVNYRLICWVQHKYKMTGMRQAKRRLRAINRDFPNLFLHWKYGFSC